MHSKQQLCGPLSHTNSRAATVALAAAIVLVLTVVVAQAVQAQTYQVLYNFTGGLDGAYPEAGLTMDGAGNLYGTAYQGGSMNRGTVYKLGHRGTGWVLSPLYNFRGQTDGGAPIAGVVFGPNGTLYGTTEFAGQLCGEGCGVVFNVRPPVSICRSTICPWTETVIYSFRGDTDGANPGYGNLTFDHAGNIYGTTYFGGNNAEGVVYKLTLSNGSWTESAIHTFSGTSDGENPYSSAIFDAAGNLYGTTFAGGAHGYGTVFQLTPNGSNWTENTLYAFQSANNGGKPFGGVVFDTAGNLYGATSSGGTNSGGTAYELMPSSGSWTFDLLYSFTGTAFLPGSYGSLTKDAAGNFYGTTVKDGANGVGSVFKLTPSNGGWTETDLYDFAGGAGGEIPYGSVLVDASGNLYGTASAAGANGYGVIWEITP